MPWQRTIWLLCQRSRQLHITHWTSGSRWRTITSCTSQISGFTFGRRARVSHLSLTQPADLQKRSSLMVSFRTLTAWSSPVQLLALVLHMFGPLGSRVWPMHAQLWRSEPSFARVALRREGRARFSMGGLFLADSHSGQKLGQPHCNCFGELQDLHHGCDQEAAGCHHLVRCPVVIEGGGAGPRRHLQVAGEDSQQSGKALWRQAGFSQ